MRRSLSGLADDNFDLLVVGAGIYGACAAWDATLRGLSVALVDQDDFGAATSANSLRMVHGGLRYLVRGNLARMRESIRERSTLLRIAPGLVEPMPVLVPIYRYGIMGRPAHRAALALNDLVSWTRNRDLEPGQMIPPGRLVSRDECLRLFPGFASAGLSGGALWYDAQLRQPERLTLSFVRAAAERGAVAANYIRVERLEARNGAVCGARATDRLSGAELDISARAVLVAAGPWTSELIATAPGGSAVEQAWGLNLVLSRRLAEVAVGIEARGSRHEDPVGGGGRFLFFAPQGGATLLGTWYALADPGGARDLRETGLRALLQGFKEACPGFQLTSRDVLRCHWGRLPLKAGRERGRAYALAERPRVVDHGRHGLRRLLSMEGVKFTTARRVAELAVDRVFASLGQSSPPCRTTQVLLPGAQDRRPVEPPAEVAREEILQAVREEMAIKLDDIVFRRTSLGAAPGPARTTVEEAARVAGGELGWDSHRQAIEIDTVMRQAGVPAAVMEAVG
ncbi:MAG: glycerol-3-phosphate dehydrogenase/oxidase [Gemmatimonadales bacterium]